jgi:hypothetical protein
VAGFEIDSGRLCFCLSRAGDGEPVSHVLCTTMVEKIRRHCLMLAEQLLAESDGRIASQEGLIARFALLGDVAEISREFLALLQAIRARRMETRDRLMSQLAK